jgi:predicted Holliday junction resolvase-like endonuclease
MEAMLVGFFIVIILLLFYIVYLKATVADLRSKIRFQQKVNNHLKIVMDEDFDELMRQVYDAAGL